MKYLIFNIAVVFSLAAIIWDKPGDRSQITEQFQSLFDDVKRSINWSSDFKEKTRKGLGGSNKNLVKNSEGLPKVVLERSESQQLESIPNEKRSQKLPRTSQKTELSKKTKNSKKTNSAKTVNTKSEITNLDVIQKPIKNNSHFASSLSEVKQKKAKTLESEQSLAISNDNRRRALLTLSEEMEFIHARFVYE